MKLSRDNSSLSASQIQDLVNQYRGLGLTHITVDCYLNGSFHDDTDRENWVAAVRNTGLKVWWRPGYESPYTGTPSDLTDLVCAFPLRRPDLFANGDIYDMLPENNAFSGTFFGANDTAKRAGWNQWLRDAKTALDSTFPSLGLSGVITGITSITDFNVTNYVETATYNALGYACIDFYPTTIHSSPQRCALAVVRDLTSLHNKAGVPVVIGEFGFTRDANASQEYQRQCLRSVFNAVSELPWVVGFNYWCGHGGAGFGEYCNLLEFQSGAWVPRAALTTIGEYYSKGKCTGRMAVI